MPAAAVGVMLIQLATAKASAGASQRTRQLIASMSRSLLRPNLSNSSKSVSPLLPDPLRLSGGASQLARLLHNRLAAAGRAIALAGDSNIARMAAQQLALVVLECGVKRATRGRRQPPGLLLVTTGSTTRPLALARANQGHEFCLSLRKDHEVSHTCGGLACPALAWKNSKTSKSQTMYVIAFLHISLNRHAHVQTRLIAIVLGKGGIGLDSATHSCCTLSFAMPTEFTEATGLTSFDSAVKNDLKQRSWARTRIMRVRARAHLVELTSLLQMTGSAAAIQKGRALLKRHIAVSSIAQHS